MHQQTLWGDTVASDDQLVEDWLYTRRAVSGPHGKRNRRETVHSALRGALDVARETAADMTLDASRNVLLTALVVTGLQAFASAAVTLTLSGVLLLAVQVMARHLDGRN